MVLRAAAPASPPATAPRSGLLRRLLGALARFLFRLTHRSTAPAELSSPHGGGVALELTLRMEAGGPAGPLVNALLGPALEPAVEDLARKIVSHLERGTASA